MGKLCPSCGADDNPNAIRNCIHCGELIPKRPRHSRSTERARVAREIDEFVAFLEQDNDGPSTSNAHSIFAPLSPIARLPALDNEEHPAPAPAPALVQPPGGGVRYHLDALAKAMDDLDIKLR